MLSMLLRTAGREAAAVAATHAAPAAAPLLVRRQPHLVRHYGARGSLPTCFGFGSHVSDNDPDVLERQKQRNLQGKAPTTVPNAPGWNEELASDSEAIVKAEQSTVELEVSERDSSGSEKLRKFSVDAIAEKLDDERLRKTQTVSKVEEERKAA